jgi:lysosomal Pro-X carboxypeptidase
MMRLVYSDLVDMAYASSAPLPLYAQNVDPNAYFDKITESAERAIAGCPAAVKATLLAIEEDVEKEKDGDVHTLANRLGICEKHGLLPKYIQTTGLLYNETLFAVAAKFAEFNMGNYPPSPAKDFSRGCAAFVDNQDLDPYQRIQAFWNVVEPTEDGSCFDFHTMIPGGPRATVFGADWTGGGPGINGLSWEFQTCKDLVVQTGYGPKSMFPERTWTLETLTAHCQRRFGIDPTPKRMVDMWHFDDLLGQNASRILFTNGLNDGWSADSILDNLSPDIVAINMPNGAHRSDLDHHGPTSRDTDDVRNSFPLIIQTLTRWLTEVRNEMHQEECDTQSLNEE